MTAAAARICCLDLDTFFVSVERVLDPTLVGKPVVVGATPGRRGVVTAASYEVRVFGVRSGMSIADAVRLAPDAVYLPTRHGVYAEYSEKVREIAGRFCPTLRVASIDEMFLDFRGCEKLYRRSVDVDEDATIERTVRLITATIRAELGLPASAGIATSKPVAKVASGLAKPEGVLLVSAGREAELLAPLPVRKFPGIGPVSEQKLAARGITTLGQIALADPTKLRHVFGAWAGYIRDGARGLGDADLGRDRPAFKEHDPDGCVVGSISNERTFMEDVSDPRSIEAQLCGLTERVCWRARKRGVRARTVTLKLRYSDFHTITRSKTMSPTHSELEVYPVVSDLVRRHRTRRLPIRLLGLALSNLGFFDDQLELFPLDPALHEALDTLRDRFGFEVLCRATSLRRARR